MKQTSSSDSMNETECSGLVHWDDAEVSDGEGGGRGFQDGENMYTHILKKKKGRKRRNNFLEESSSLSHSVVFLYFFALIT